MVAEDIRWRPSKAWKNVGTCRCAGDAVAGGTPILRPFPNPRAEGGVDIVIGIGHRPGHTRTHLTGLYAAAGPGPGPRKKPGAHLQSPFFQVTHGQSAGWAVIVGADHTSASADAAKNSVLHAIV
jgi:hypothetical protein